MNGVTTNSHRSIPYKNIVRGNVPTGTRNLRKTRQNRFRESQENQSTKFPRNKPSSIRNIQPTELFILRNPKTKFVSLMVATRKRQRLNTHVDVDKVISMKKRD